MNTQPKPSAFLLMIQGGGALTWCQLEYDEWQNITHRPEQYTIYAITGQSAVIFVATEDNELDRRDAVKCASAFVYGLYQTTHVDLDKLISYTEDGKPFMNPPY